MATALTKRDGDATGKLCPNCGRPTLWEEILIPIITDIPDAEATGEFIETCSRCAWNANDEEERLQILADSETLGKCPICELGQIRLSDNTCQNCKAVAR